MITRAEVEKLGALHVVEPTMLSLYLAVPPSADPAVLGGRAGELIAAAEAVTGRAVEPRAGERVRDKLATCARDWPGRTVAVFACAGSGLFEAIQLPCPLPERAVLGVRPHIRPLLLARQRCPVPGQASPDVAWWSEVPARRTVATILAMPSGGRLEITGLAIAQVATLAAARGLPIFEITERGSSSAMSPSVAASSRCLMSSHCRLAAPRVRTRTQLPCSFFPCRVNLSSPFFSAWPMSGAAGS